MTLPFTSCTIACFGRELNMDGSPKEETIRRAHEVGKFWLSQRDKVKIKRIVCTGGWPKSMNGMPEPPRHLREAIHQYNILVNEYGVPSELIGVEPDSRKTLEQFKFPLMKGYFTYGSYTKQDPIVFAVSIPTSWRIAMLALHGLGAPRDAMWQLNPGNTTQDNNHKAQVQERNLAVVQQLAITIAEQKGHRASSQTAPAYFDAIYQEFKPLWQQWLSGELGTFAEFMARYKFTWPLIEIPVLAY